jgi:hypothetical protein
MRPRIAAIDLRAGLVADEIDEPRDPQRLAGVVDEEHESGEAGERHQVADEDGEARDRAGLVVDLAEAEDGEDEGGEEQTDGGLVAPVLEQGAHDPGRELPHGQLHRHERHRQHDAREAAHGVVLPARDRRDLAKLRLDGGPLRVRAMRRRRECRRPDAARPPVVRHGSEPGSAGRASPQRPPTEGNPLR